VKVVVDKQESHYLNDQQRKCHLVFKSSTYEQFKNSNPERVPGTCLWALEHPQYKQWLESQEHNLLWISADPGCGKSVLSRSLVENDLYHTNSRFVCYFFFKDNEQQDRLNIALCALLHQLFDQQPQLLKHAMPEWQKNGEKLREETERLWSILLNAAAGSDSCDIICVLDALDECQESDRRILVRKLSNFYKECSSKRLRGKSLKFLVTSRPYDDIVSGFRDIPQYLPTIRLSGEDENKRIHQEIDIVIQERVRRLAIDMPLSDSTAISLEQSLLKMEHRTYLWLYLAFHSIEEQYRDRLFPDSESIVSLQLPKSVEDAYEKILSKITKNQKPVALKILHIIVGAYRPLTIAEMAIALGLAELPNSQAYAEFRITINLETYIRRLCGLFVFVKDSKIYLLHQTAKEFLCQKQPERASSGWKHCLNPIDSETTMTRICIAYLALKEVGQIKYKFDLLNLKVEISEPKHGIGAFLEYSAIHWPSHFRNSAVEIENMVAKACSLYRKECLDLWFPILLKARRHYQSPIDMNNVLLAAFNGHDVILRDFLKTGITNLEEHDTTGRTALIWAAELGFIKVVKILLDKKADFNTQGGDYGNALQAASAKGHQAVIELLLEKGANINTQEGNYSNALQIASINGHQAVVELLLEKGANINIRGGDYGNALQAASVGGYQAVVELLLEKGANINARGGNYGNALQGASAQGHQAVIELLLEKGANINARGGDYGNALQAASAGGYQAAVKLFLAKGADVNAKGGIYRNDSLQMASANGHQAVVELLLANGANFNAQAEGGNYDNALQAASINGHQAVVELLLAKGANINARGGDYGNALQAASANGHQAIVKLLLAKGADINAQGGVYGNAFNAASMEGHQIVAQLLQEEQISKLKLKEKISAIVFFYLFFWFLFCS
jgi:ankyrin repeat protein